MKTNKKPPRCWHIVRRYGKYPISIITEINKLSNTEVKIMKNQEIREHAKAKGVKLWQIADKLGINDGNFSRKLRHELAEDEKAKILNIIDELAKER